MSLKSDRVKEWRKNTKQKIVDGFSGCCGICGYNRCNDALEFHHLDPSEKEFGLGTIMAHPKKWDVIKNEMEKCVCLCSICHREVHAGIREIPKDIKRFEEVLGPIVVKTHLCEVCGKETPNYQITCSKKCGAKRAGKIDWEKYDLKSMMREMSIVKMSEIIGCSDVAIHKRLKKHIPE